MEWFDGFEARSLQIDGQQIHFRCGGIRGAPGLLLLHGFPQTHVMWHRVATTLTQRFFVVLPDLRGYGHSGKPAGGDGHAAYSKRAMARDALLLMRALGFERFGVAGHDRGGRAGHRLALDHPTAVDRLCVIDIAPTLDMYERTDMAFALAYHHWFHLVQPEPLPERMIAGDPRFYLHAMLGGWGAEGLDHIEAPALTEYEGCFCQPEAIHAACEDYRASAGIDLLHDRASRKAGQKVTCELLLLLGERGVVNRLFDAEALWQAQCAQPIQTHRFPQCGHYVPEERPVETAKLLLSFFSEGMSAHVGQPS